MKQAKKMSDLEKLEIELKAIDQQIKEIEECQNQVDTCYLRGKSYAMSQVFGYSADSKERYSHSYSLMMTEADQNEIKLDELKKLKNTIMQQIEEEKAKNAMGFGGWLIHSK